MTKKALMIHMIEYSNSQLARTDLKLGYSKDFKSGICVMIEQILHKENAYYGFSFNDNDECDVESISYYNRKYYVHPKLKK